MEEINELENMMAPTPETMVDPNGMQMGIDQMTSNDVAEAQNALGEIRALVQEMLASGMSEEEIDQFLKQFGVSLQDLAYAEQTIQNPEIMNKMGVGMETSQNNNIDSMLNNLR